MTRGANRLFAISILITRYTHEANRKRSTPSGYGCLVSCCRDLFKYGPFTKQIPNALCPRPPRSSPELPFRIEAVAFVERQGGGNAFKCYVSISSNVKRGVGDGRWPCRCLDESVCAAEGRR